MKWNKFSPPPFLPSFSFVSVRYIGQFISLFAPSFFFFFFVATFKWNISICPWLSVRAHVPWYASSRLINATSMSLYFSACYKKISKIPFHSFHSLNNRFRIIFFFFFPVKLQSQTVYIILSNGFSCKRSTI